jgi:hypothetical protein
MRPSEPLRIASCTACDWNASTKPSRWSRCSSTSMERETSTASTSARSTSVSPLRAQGRRRKRGGGEQQRGEHLPQRHGTLHASEP